MNVLKITNGFNKLSDPHLESRAQQIHDSMDGNANFPTPEPTMAAFTTALTAYSAALSASKEGGKLAVAIKNQKREELTDLLHLLGDYVIFAVKGDRVKAVSSGFNVNKIPVPAPPIAKPVNLRVENGLNAGELQTVVEKVKGAISYMHQVTNDATLAETSWRTVTCSTSQALITNLQPGTKYYCRVGAVGARMQLVYSDVVSRIAI